MTRVIALGASTSSESINQRFAEYTASRVPGVEVVPLQLFDYEMPLYRMDRERDGGIPAQGRRFLTDITAADAIVLSLAEHNGMVTAAFKNTIDWASRAERNLWGKKPMFLLSASPGPRGGKGAHDMVTTMLPFMGARIVATFSLPRFNANFEKEQGITDPDLRSSFEEQLSLFNAALDS